ncbi:MAG: preprotein translocase subunit SecA, partial [Bacteroidota bacterium]
MINFIKKLFGDSNERELQKLDPLVDEINQHAEAFQRLSDDDLRAKTDAFKARIREAVQGIEEEQREIEQRLRSATATDGPVGGDGQAAEVETLSFRDRQALYRDLEDLDAEWLDTVEDILEDILPEAFAVAKETCRRMVGQSWTAGGSEIEWNMIPYDVQLIGGI